MFKRSWLACLVATVRAILELDNLPRFRGPPAFRRGARRRAVFFARLAREAGDLPQTYLYGLTALIAGAKVIVPEAYSDAGAAVVFTVYSALCIAAVRRK